MKWLTKFSRKTRAAVFFALAAGVILIVLCLISSSIKRIPDSQNLVRRWAPDGGYTEVSVFYPKESAPDAMSLKSFEHTLDERFKTDGIEAPDEHARMWLSAYSGAGSVQVSSDRSSIDAAAVGTGGDFFLFHPFQLLSGSFYSGSDFMQDGIMLDEDAAWQLFGAYDVAGKTVNIAGVVHYVSGVIRRDSSLMDRKAGGDKMTVYLSYDSLSRYGSTDGVSCYELLLPNPVSGYGLRTVKDNLGADPEKCVIVENSRRYSLPALLKVIGAFGTRSMQTTGIIWPVWENAARGFEDILALILVFEIICAAVLAVDAAAVLVWAVRRLKKVTGIAIARRHWQG